ncbi:HAD family hydrolase [Nonomuraea endophytica]|uniref:HAD superfamily hydrolase (TIGR01509 family) n=1 Tax=Nonomuraea endophytica TaxID=714136 RepID=A0A7W8EE68_9ACTN|nr:HAD family phosphatase [Nonomuraea endophytica]MBB5076284.1 HAD superfamily hydrolase (TIGR01509 family) [Nonomuraea endophytica]
MPSDLPAAVLFDMDGTLVDTEGLWWQATADVAESLGHGGLGPEDVPHVLGRSVEDTAAHLAPADAGAVAVRLTDAFAERIAGGIDLIPGALDLLRELTAAGVPTALVTASPRSIVERVLPNLDGHRFDLVITAEDSSRGKPYPDPYLKAARLLGVRPQECVAVEDSPTGIAAATSAGCRVVVVDPAHGLPELHSMSVS